jgi:hypothetical protein
LDTGATRILALTHSAMNEHLRTAIRALALLGALAATTAHGEDGPAWTFSGFGTIGGVTTNTDGGQFRSTARQTHGATRSTDFGVDSRLGVQENLKIDETFSAVGQVLSGQQGSGFQPRVEWLFAQANVTPWLDVRAGRMVLPVFLVSDTRNVGYVAHWARAPSEVYSLYPASSFDGVEADMRTDWHGTHFALQAAAGTSRVNFVGFGQELNIDFSKLYSLNLVVQRGDLTLRVGDTESFRTKLSQFIVELPTFRDSFRGVGGTYDNGRWLLQYEYVQRRTSDHLLDMNGYYVTAGYHFGVWTPYATYSHYDPTGALLTGLPQTRTVAGGIRWDLFHDVALKAQVESGQNNGFNFAGATPAFAATAPKVTIFTLLVDFVF